MRCLTVESGNLSIVNNSLQDGHSSKYWGNAGLGWDFWCTLGNGPEIGGKIFVLGVGAGNGENSIGQALFPTRETKSVLLPCAKLGRLAKAK